MGRRDLRASREFYICNANIWYRVWSFGRVWIPCLTCRIGSCVSKHQRAAKHVCTVQINWTQDNCWLVVNVFWDLCLLFLWIRLTWAISIITAFHLSIKLLKYHRDIAMPITSHHFIYSPTERMLELISASKLIHAAQMQSLYALLKLVALVPYVICRRITRKKIDSKTNKSIGCLECLYDMKFKRPFTWSSWAVASHLL